MNGGAFRDDDQAGSVFIEAVNDADLGFQLIDLGLSRSLRLSGCSSSRLMLNL